MDLIADALLLAGALTAAIYCWVLSKRVKGLNDLDTGLGSAIASLSTQVNDMQSTLRAAQSVTGSSVSEMEELADRAERAAEHLKLMLATVQEDRQPAPRKTARVRKFPKPTAPVPEPEVAEPDVPEPEIAQAPVAKAPEKARRVDPPIQAEPKTSPAEKLQNDIVARIADRDDQGSREDLVQVLQSILAASK